MKKFRFISLLLVFVLFSCVFAGCTKADSATLESVQQKFVGDIQEYLTKTNHVGSAIIQKNSDVYTFVFNPDNDGIADLIGKNKNDLKEEEKVYYNLSNKEEYYELITHASKYFFTRFTTNAINSFVDELNDVKQAKWTALYKSVENVLSDVSNFGKDYRKFSADFQNDNLSSQSTKNVLNNLLKDYKELIGSVLDMNLASLDIYDNSLKSYKDLSVEGAKVPYDEIDRLVDAFELYVTEYLYQRYMVMGSNLDANFMDNSLLVAMKNLVSKREEAKSKTRCELDDKLVYEYLRTIETSMLDTINLNRHSAKILTDGLPNTDSKKYAYKKAIYDDFTGYEATLLAYINQIDALLDATISA